ncbi:uncharacterized protein SAPINGB_P001759 [Magnusiomyces paraingens]|uniref:Uncharacterized protein n=1 Tax=Magnusiomyces paraingens TaxID=2606893 RepID=A0A5E8BB32_9ASCO|nr:uncharacterized protein SAPINGB_P001759 [Saprochaete ingens]VVT48398.1 unnamed protein product [Saprochaete ingens]
MCSRSFVFLWLQDQANCGDNRRPRGTDALCKKIHRKKLAKHSPNHDSNDSSTDDNNINIDIDSDSDRDRNDNNRRKPTVTTFSGCRTCGTTAAATGVALATWSANSSTSVANV